MSFSNSDLKRLKADQVLTGDNLQFLCRSLPALLARLEAAEVVIECTIGPQDENWKANREVWLRSKGEAS